MLSVVIIKLVRIFAPILATSFTITLLITPMIKKLSLKAGVVDAPSARKVHTVPTPRLGGVAIYLSFIISTLVSLPLKHPYMGILLGSLVIVSIGVLDDIFNLGAWIKLGGQMIAASVAYFSGVTITVLSNPFGSIFFLDWLAFPVTVFWIIVLINTINLLDGLDGLAAGVTVISATMLCIVAVQNNQYPAAILAVAVIGANLGFLRYNFFPAQIFMGDSGSMFLGYILAVTSIIGVVKSTITLSLVVPLLILGIPVSDTIFAIVRRMRSKKAIFAADNNHIHHNLIKIGLTPKQVVLSIYFGTFLLGACAIMVSNFTGMWALLVFTLCVLVIYATLFFINKNRAIILAKLKY